MSSFNLSVKLDVKENVLSVVVNDSTMVVNSIDSSFDVTRVLPKTVHAIVCGVVSDSLAKAFNDLLSLKEVSK